MRPLSSALSAGAPEAARTYLTRALTEPPAASQTAGILRLLGHAEASLYLPEAVEHLRAALDHTDDVRERAELTRELAVPLVHSGHIHEAVSVLERSSDELAGADRELSLELEADLVNAGRLHSELRRAALARACALRDAGLQGRTFAERVALAAVAGEGDAVVATAKDAIGCAAERPRRRPVARRGGRRGTGVLVRRQRPCARRVPRPRPRGRGCGARGCAREGLDARLGARILLPGPVGASSRRPAGGGGRLPSGDRDDTQRALGGEDLRTGIPARHPARLRSSGRGRRGARRKSDARHGAAAAAVPAAPAESRATADQARRDRLRRGGHACGREGFRRRLLRRLPLAMAVACTRSSWPGRASTAQALELAQRGGGARPCLRCAARVGDLAARARCRGGRRAGHCVVAQGGRGAGRLTRRAGASPRTDRPRGRAPAGRSAAQKRSSACATAWTSRIAARRPPWRNRPAAR